jgi:peptidyl-prolyl cis-trans isomerase SurA
MKNRGKFLRTIGPVLAAGLVFSFLAAVPTTRAEVIEEVVAVVNGEVITRSEFEEEEQALLSAAYSQFSGEELDRQVAQIRGTVLSQIIDRKVLMHMAARLFDLTGYEEMLLEQFKQDQSVETTKELEQLLAPEGMSIDDLRRRLIEQVAPRQIIDMEVGGRIACSDQEISEFYDENTDQFKVSAEFTLREIVILADDTNREEKRILAGEVHGRASAPDADFAALAKEYSEAGTRETGGDLGTMAAGDLNPALEKIAMQVATGQVGEPVETEYGFHLIQVVSRQEAGVKSLDEVEGQIRTFLENTQYFDKLQEFLKKVRDEADIQIRPRYQDRFIEAS